MKVQLYVNVTEALKAGKDDHGYKVVEVPAASLTPEQREELARYRYHKSDNAADFDLGDNCVSQYFPLAEARAEKVPMLLDGLIARRQQEESDKQAKHESAVSAWLSAPTPALVRINGSNCSVQEYYNGHGRPNDPRLEAKLAEASALAEQMSAECKARREAERIESERRTAEEQARKNAGRQVLKDWARIYGSDLLKARIEEGFSWEGLAEKEYAASVLGSLQLTLESCDGKPEGYAQPDVEERTTPTLEEIQTVRAIRTEVEAKSLPVAVALRWMIYAPAADEEGCVDYDAATIKRTELELTVTCLNGSERSYYYLPTTAKQTVS